ncbi:cation-transporting P-type ATPase [Desulfogranum marinum]|uniref:cation-transporting P-type ATPase n=1 Tax=Desulfogranum marinum TaxID=453220 RepID=UPI001E2873C4|nr:cation-transporting P-type ATPase [Desulfogranum marinum]
MTSMGNNREGNLSTWHALPAEKVLEDLDSSTRGLTTDEVTGRKQQYGPNRLPAPPRPSRLIQFLNQFNNVLIYVLLCAAVVTALLADWVDAIVIIGVVLINAVIGFIQEGKAEKAVDAIRKILSYEAIVFRDGEKVSIQVEDLVPGDVVFLNSGDKVPADLRLFQSKDLRIEEALLTGESVPADKSIEPANIEAALGDRSCMAFSGTMVSFGQGRGVVVATGESTELGKVSAMLAGVETLKTRLTQRMDEFSKWLTGAILILAIGTTFFGLALRDYSFTELFFAGVALAVAAIPEGLPAIITITLALGVQRMARKKAIIRRLPAVETLGSVTVICSDKTGTLTRNEMTVTTILRADRTYTVDGVGYQPVGSFHVEGNMLEAKKDHLLLELARAGLQCNDGSISEKDGSWSVQGDPTDGALITLALKAGLDSQKCNEALPRIDVIPFESEHKFMATLHQDSSGKNVVYLKGAPERVLDMCVKERHKDSDKPINLTYWQEQIEAIASQGQRTLAVATISIDDKETISIEDVKSGMILLGLFGIIDPPRDEAVAAVQNCLGAGIKVKMITGDHALTATSIGEQIGLDVSTKAITGQELEAMDDDQMEFIAKKANIFARVSPEHKLRLVTALQANGQITAMTGDGINDAPALKRADVGVAMGMNGTEAAKEAAEMVLADDNFASIVHAVEEGRTVYDNIRKTLAFILPTNGAQAGIIIASVMMGIALPITPLQILWVNMITAVTLGLSLAFEPPEGDVMTRAPLSPKEPLLNQFLSWRIIFISAIMVMGTLGLFLWDRYHGETLEMARTTAVNTLIFFQIFYLFNARYLKESVLSRKGLFGNPAILMAVTGITLLQLFFTYAPFFQNVFGTAAIPFGDWIRLIGFTFTVFVLVETEKMIMRHLDKKRLSE